MCVLGGGGRKRERERGGGELSMADTWAKFKFLTIKLSLVVDLYILDDRGGTARSN